MSGIFGTLPDSPQALLEFVINLMLNYGYLVIFLGAALDNFGLLASGDIVIFAGGWLSNTGRLNLAAVIATGAVGASCSDNAMYWIGRKGGRPLINRVLKMPLLSKVLDVKHLSQVEEYFEAHGGKTVMVGRVGPGMRSATPLFAGVSRMSYPRFLAFNSTAIILWAIFYGIAGAVFGEYWNEVLAAVRSVGVVILAFVALTVTLFIYRRRKRAREGSSSDES